MLVVMTMLFDRATAAQECPVQIPDSERRDCYPWPGASQSLCEARGCVWCSSATGGIPWCFYNDKVGEY